MFLSKSEMKSLLPFASFLAEWRRWGRFKSNGDHNRANSKHMAGNVDDNEERTF
jgi:hypothetical protein